MNVSCHLKKNKQQTHLDPVRSHSAILLHVLPRRAWDRWIFVHSPSTVCLLELAKMASSGMVSVC